LAINTTKIGKNNLIDLIFTIKKSILAFLLSLYKTIIAMRDDPPRKKRKGPGAGLSGGTVMMSRAEEKVMGASHSGTTDAGTQKKYYAAMEAEHARTGEAKSSYTQRTKKNPKVATLDTTTGKRTNQKKKLTPAQKAKAKTAKHNATAGKTRHEKKMYRQR
jgi:hypothetical protein